jgi:hypothetical protein
MGWSGGSELMNEIIDVLNDERIDAEAKFRIYKKLIDAFTSQDCDTLHECFDDPIFKDAYFACFPDELEEYEEMLYGEG